MSGGPGHKDSSNHAIYCVLFLRLHCIAASVWRAHGSPMPLQYAVLRANGWFKHVYVQIPKCKHVRSHPIAGKARVNLTFRQLKPAWAEKAPCCRCGQRAVMKASLPSSAATEQQYYYTCDNTKGPGCGFFLRAQVT